MEKKETSGAELTFKKNLKKLRLAHPDVPTCSEVARQIEVSPSTYLNMENINKHMNVKFQTMDRLAEYYNIPVAELFQEA